MHADSWQFQALLLALLAVHYWWITLPVLAALGYGLWRFIRARRRNADEIALRAAQEIALMWGQDRSQFVSKIQVRVLAAMREAAP